MSKSIDFIDLAAQRRHLGQRLEAAIAGVLAHGQFIQGPEVGRFEKALAAFAGVRHAVGCANGTDALMLALMALGVGRGDAVFVPSFTFVATAEAPALLGATPVLVDVREESFNMDPASLERAIPAARAAGLDPKAVIPVDLFGLPADYDTLGAVAAKNGMAVLADAAQSMGGVLQSRKVGGLAPVTATSFFPAKPLGCYGDGGAVLTEDDLVAERVRSLGVHGKGKDKYDNVRIGTNSRLDTLQAAILIEKLAILDEEIEKRQIVARRYTAALGDRVAAPAVPPDRRSAWAQYTILHPARDRLAAALKAAGIPTAIYYPTPLHRQTAYRDFPADPAGLPVSERLAQAVLSLPMHPYLDEATQARIIDAVRGAA